MTKNNTPALRFAGFSGEWDEQPLGAIADRVQTKNTKLASTLPLTISALHGLVNQITYFNNRVASSNLTNYLLIHNGEFAYNKSYSEGYPVGAVKRLDGYDKGVLSSLYVVFRLLSARDVDSDFVLSFFETSKWHRYVEMQSAEGARNHGLLNISADTFMGVPVSLAPSLKEQQAIGELFADLDALIEQHRAKHANLQQTKAALLQRMFPPDGANEPELRLGGFSGGWNSCTFGQLAVLSRGLTYSPRDLVDPYQGIRVYRSSNIKDHIVVTNPDDVWVRASAVNIPLLAKGDIIITASNGSVRLVGKSGLVRELPVPGTPGGFMLKCSSKTPEFTAALLQSPWFRSFLNVNVAGGNGAIGNLDSTQLSNEPTLIPPTLEEQRAIGEVFTNLDALIAAAQRYITQLAQAKTALLQRMFV
ncbi:MULTISPECIES: restriction endonuclease subunit S [Corynebacterium]|uniref:restriction endonuclease subunit S n=1 Tax=Corynebacterium TaxID=1716 RepID=UPI00124BB41D|nr:restriction endonuclease subunit S [Corynebacterium sp. MSK012]MDK8828743.1 restriction endonuclease subunit S [Corynebacterium sp. MSK012]